jgi:multidrug transporter EmrE-like cation transporter
MVGVLYLAFTVLLDVAGTIALKLADGFTKFVPSVSSLILYGL